MEQIMHAKLSRKLSKYTKKLADVESLIADTLGEHTPEGLLSLHSLYEEKEQVAETIQGIELKLSKVNTIREKTPRFKVRVDQSIKDLSVVPPELVDTSQGLISTESPLGRALNNLKSGTTVRYNTPFGPKYCEVLKIVGTTNLIN